MKEIIKLPAKLYWVKTAIWCAFIIVSALLFPHYAKSQTAKPDIFLNRYDILSTMQIAMVNVQHFNCPDVEWNLPTGIHKVLRLKYSCGNYGNADFILDTNTAMGRVVTSCFNSQLTVPDYIEIELHDYYCGLEAAGDNYKASFAISSSFHTPYQGSVLSVPQVEMDSILRYGVPDPSLGYSVANPAADPPYKMIVSPGFGDAYGFTYYNNGIGIDGVPDGYYYLTVTINIPADIQEGNIYPNSLTAPIHIVGMTVTNPTSAGWIAPSAQSIPSDPYGINISTGQGNKINNGGLISFIGTGDACAYKISTFVQIRGNQYQLAFPPDITQNTSYILHNLQKGYFYKFGVSAINSAGSSSEVQTGKYQVK